MTNTHPKRRFFRYSLRTLMLVVTVFCIWMGITAKRAREQRQAVEAIREVGGFVYHEHQMHPSYSPSPKWLLRLIGEDYFSSVSYVFMFGPTAGTDPSRSKVNDVSLAAIERFTDLRWLSLSNTQFTDAHMEYLNGLTKLEKLYLSGNPISDEGLLQLKGLTNLQELGLYATQVTDEGVMKLQEALPNCKILH